MNAGCCSRDCDKHEECVLYYVNLQLESPVQLIAWASHGYGTIGVKESKTHFDCGPCEDYAMFRAKVE